MGVDIPSGVGHFGSRQTRSLSLVRSPRSHDASCGTHYTVSLKSCTVLSSILIKSNIIQRNRDYDAFLGDLEEDKTFRQHVNIYVGK